MPPSERQPYPQSKPYLKGLTVKQQRFVTEDIKMLKETGANNPTKAAAIAYPNTIVPSVIASENLSKPKIRAAYISAMQEAGITDELLTNKLKEGLDATQTIVTKEDGVLEVPDNRARLGYLQEAHKIKDLYPDEKINIDRRTANIDIKVDGKNNDKLTQNIKELRNEIAGIQDDY